MKASPVQRSMISESHSHPVYSLNVIGSQHANNIVSASNDGKICVWSLNMFTSPHISVEVKNGYKEIAGHCVAFPENETNKFFMGSEDGLIVQSQLHNSTVSEGQIESI
jgi:dynein intermediate chain